MDDYCIILPDIISIHALREEGDLQCLVTWSSHRYFYPRPPRGGRPERPAIGRHGKNFYPRPPRGGRLERRDADYQTR